MINKNLIRQMLGRGLPVPRAIRPLIRRFYDGGVVLTEGCIFLRKVFWVEPVLRSICEEVGDGLRADRMPYIRGRGRLRLGNGVHLSGRSCFYFMRGLAERPAITIGDQVFIGNGCTLSAGRQITIGAHVLISAGVRIHDNDGHPRDAEKRIAGMPMDPADMKNVTIEEGAWIGAEATILKGVTIGRNAIVGTGAVVTSDVPPATVVAGNPARICEQARDRSTGSQDVED